MSKQESAMPNPPFEVRSFLAGAGSIARRFETNEAVFAQGDASDALFYIVEGAIKIKVNSRLGKEAVVGLLGPGAFFGEGCLSSQPTRMSTAVATEPSSVFRLERESTVRMLHEKPQFAEAFLAHVLARNARIEEDLVDQLFNSSEKRLARVLLLLANYGNPGLHRDVPKISQETLASIVGTTRSRVSFFMNRFRDLGFIEYNGGIKVHSSLLSVVLND